MPRRSRRPPQSTPSHRIRRFSRRSLGYRTGFALHHAKRAAEESPGPQVESDGDSPRPVLHAHASADAIRVTHNRMNRIEKPDRNEYVGIDKDKDVATGVARPGVPGPGDALYRFVNRLRAPADGDRGRGIGAVVVDHHRLDVGFTAGTKAVCGGLYRVQGGEKTGFLVEGGNDDRNIH